jgi:imidazoleglycerol-phosphate dehydratase
MAMKKRSKKNGHVPPDEEPKLPVPIRRPVREERAGRAGAHAHETRGHAEPEPEPMRSEPPPRATPRRGTVHRRTKETDVVVALELDGTGRSQIETGIPFLDHMLDSLARHSLIDLKVVARGDVDVDPHHTVEDVGLCIGRALIDAMGDRAGMSRYGDASIPFDETLVRCAVDFSGRPAFIYKVTIAPGRIGTFDVELAEVFFNAISNEARMNLHLNLEYGSNRHHIVEGCFKALARAMLKAIEIDPRRNFQIASTKGSLD